MSFYLKIDNLICFDIYLYAYTDEILQDPYMWVTVVYNLNLDSYEVMQFEALEKLTSVKDWKCVLTYGYDVSYRKCEHVDPKQDRLG